MQIILLKDVKDLGKKGEVVSVSDGHGRNFLIPKGYAKIATEGSIKESKAQQQKVAEREALALEEAQKLALSLEGKEVTILAKGGTAGRLFGAITSKEISEALKTQLQVEIDKKKIELKEPLKIVGTYDIRLKVYPHVTTTIKVILKIEE